MKINASGTSIAIVWSSEITQYLTGTLNVKNGRLFSFCQLIPIFPLGNKIFRQYFEKEVKRKYKMLRSKPGSAVLGAGITVSVAFEADGSMH